MAEIPINYLKYIDQDGTEKKVYPITVTDAVYDSDGNKLSNVLLGVLKDTDISNVQSDSTTTVPSSALLKATDDKIGDTSSLPGDSSNVVSAINQLNSDKINKSQTSVSSIESITVSGVYAGSNLWGDGVWSTCFAVMQVDKAGFIIGFGTDKNAVSNITKIYYAVKSSTGTWSKKIVTI